MSDVEVTLRVPTDRDRAVLRDIRNDFEVQAILLGHPEARADRDDTDLWLARRNEDANGAFYAIIHAGNCVGFVQLNARHGLDRHARFGIALARSAWGAGIGSASMRALIGQATADGLRKLICEVREDNTPALGLYRRLGFRTVGTLQAHYDDGVRRWDVIVMEKRLDRDPVG